MAARKKTTKTKKSNPSKEVKNNLFKNFLTKIKIAPKRVTTKINKKYFGGAILAIILGLTFFHFKYLVIAATVNGQPISRLQVISDLEKNSGSQALQSIITQTVITQEAKKENVSVTPAEIDAEIKKIEDSLKSQGQDLNTALSSQGMTKADLEKQVSLQKLVEKMVGKDINITDKEIDDYIKANKDTFPKDEKPENIKSSVKDQLFQQKLSQEFQTWIAKIKAEAKINYFVKY